MKSLWRGVWIVAVGSGLMWGLVSLPARSQSRSDDEHTSALRAGTRAQTTLRPLQREQRHSRPTSTVQGHSRTVPAQWQRRSNSVLNSRYRPVASTPETEGIGTAYEQVPRFQRTAGDAGRRRVSLVAGGTTSTDTLEMLSFSHGNPQELSLHVARIWPDLRPNRLVWTSIANFSTAGKRMARRQRQDDASQRRSRADEAAPISIAIRPGRIFLVSEDAAAVATLNAVLKAFSPTPRMQGLPLASYRLQGTPVQQLAAAIKAKLGTAAQRRSAAMQDRNNYRRRRDRDDPLAAIASIRPTSVRIYADSQSNTLVYQANARERAIIGRVLQRVDRVWSENGFEQEDAVNPRAEMDTENDLQRADDLPDDMSDDVPPTLNPLPHRELRDESVEDRFGSDDRFGQPAFDPPRQRDADRFQRRGDQLERDSEDGWQAARSGGARVGGADTGRGELRRSSGVQRDSAAGGSSVRVRSADDFNDERESQPFTRRQPVAPPRRIARARSRAATRRAAQQEPQEPQQQTPPQRAPVQQRAIGTGGLRGEVQIEVIPELGIFLIEGSDEDVAEVQRIIQQIQELSAGRAPIVEIVPLEHVQATALAGIVNAIYGQILTSRGLLAGGQEVTAATSLGKPNALLIVAPQDDMEFLIQQIKRLDQPVAPETQFRVFRLKHAPAAILETALTEFYTDPAGLATAVRVTSEARSNTLIVSAAPRDMAEIENWIAQIDVPDTDTVNDLRIFRLQHTAAEELAEILQQAILGVLQPASRLGGLTGGQAVPGALAPPTGQAGGQAGVTQLLQQPTSSVLRFSVSDAKGNRDVVSGILTEVRITPDPASNSLIVSAPEKSMELVEVLIGQLDVIPSAIADIQVFTLQNADATSVVAVLQDLFQTDAAADEGPQAILPAAAAPGAEGSTLVRLRFREDRRTNSVMAVGSSSDLLTVNSIIVRLDSSDVTQRKMEVFPLRHSPAEQVAQAINDLLRTEQQQLQQIDPESISAFQQIEREVIVVPETVNNFLLIAATPRYFEEISKLITKLDERPPMVGIQVLIAEVELGDHDEFGLELGIQDGLLFDRSFLSDVQFIESTVTGQNQITQTTQNVLSATLDPGFNFNNQPLGNSGSDLALSRSNRIGPQGLTSFSLGRVNSELNFGGLVLSAGSENVSMLLRALKQYRRLDILSRPQIVTLDNQPALMQVGEDVPVIEQSTLGQFGQTNSVTFRQVGVVLGVTPRISPDGIVTMMIDAERSEVGPEDEGIPVSITTTGDVVRSPRIPRKLAQTTVSARSGQTVILGGMLSKNKRVIERRVPWLSDVPILGNAFRYDLSVEGQTELLIILTPRILEDDDDMEMFKQMEARRMNWVLSDVQQLHGDINVYEEVHDEPADETKEKAPGDASAHHHHHRRGEVNLDTQAALVQPPDSHSSVIAATEKSSKQSARGRAKWFRFPRRLFSRPKRDNAAADNASRSVTAVQNSPAPQTKANDPQGVNAAQRASRDVSPGSLVPPTGFENQDPQRQ